MTSTAASDSCKRAPVRLRVHRDQFLLGHVLHAHPRRMEGEALGENLLPRPEQSRNLGLHRDVRTRDDLPDTIGFFSHACGLSQLYGLLRLQYSMAGITQSRALQRKVSSVACAAKSMTINDSFSNRAVPQGDISDCAIGTNRSVTWVLTPKTTHNVYILAYEAGLQGVPWKSARHRQHRTRRFRP